MTPEEARNLLKHTTPGPWEVSSSRSVVGINIMMYSASPETERQRADTALIAAAPDMAATLAGMHEEWGVRWPADDISPEWTAWGFRSAEDACEHIVDLSAPDKPSPDIRIVRRYVTKEEEA